MSLVQRSTDILAVLSNFIFGFKSFVLVFLNVKAADLLNFFPEHLLTLCLFLAFKGEFFQLSGYFLKLLEAFVILLCLLFKSAVAVKNGKVLFRIHKYLIIVLTVDIYKALPYFTEHGNS